MSRGRFRMVGELVSAMFGDSSANNRIEIPANPDLIKQLAGVK